MHSKFVDAHVILDGRRVNRGVRGCVKTILPLCATPTSERPRGGGRRRRGAEISSSSDATSCAATCSLRARALDGVVAVGGVSGGPRLRGVLASVSSPTRGGELRPRIRRGQNVVEQRE
jgi:hypothetical protein